MSEESMVEKVARALAKKDDTHRHWRDLDASSQIIYKGLARAAIEAMRAPTDAMEDAILNTDCCGPRSTEPKTATWTNAINAALKETV